VQIRIKKGLDIPAGPGPEPTIVSGPAVKSVALLGADYVDLKPRVLVAEGQRVRLGQPLVADRRNPAVVLTSPGCGSVAAVVRGERRSLRSLVVRLEGEEEETFPAHPPGELESLSEASVRETLLASGSWSALRTRPFGTIPAPDSRPRSIFVTAMDTNPLALPPDLVLRDHAGPFRAGLQVLKKLTAGPLFVCCAPGTDVESPPDSGLEIVTFHGPHPAGLPGTHIHFLDPVGPGKTVWYIGYQEVIAVGWLFTTGRLWTERFVSVAGPMVREPRVVRTRPGASLEDLLEGGLREGGRRVISGSVLSGRRAVGPDAYLGRHHTQVSVFPEGTSRRFLGWLAPGRDRYSSHRAFLSSLVRPRGPFEIDTGLGGAPRALVPIGNFEKVMPLDLLPTLLLRHLLVKDTETARRLGCLELEEEDLALCSFVCPSKFDFGPLLRDTLTTLGKGG